jgi:DeoR/GlpR family transcriptional regulator of sugar metabolism
LIYFYPHMEDARANALPAQDRRQMVLERLQLAGEVSVAELSREAGVSEMTIRRDLEALERAGALRRVHGGAISAVSRSYEPPFALRAGREPESKRRIGEVAASLLSEGDTAVIDVGSTPLELAHSLREANRLTILTPSLRAAQVLSENASLRVIMTGGVLRPGELSLIGDLSERAFEELHPDVVFLGVAGVDRDAGLTEYNLDDTRVKRAALQSARRCVVLADSSKLGRVAFARVCSLDRVDVLVTDEGAEDSALDWIREAGVEVLVA